MSTNISLSDNIAVLEHYRVITSYHTPLFAKKGIGSVSDLLEHYPVRYEDRKTLLTIVEAGERCVQEEEKIFNLICLCLKKTNFNFQGRQIKKFVFTDKSGDQINLTAFNPAHGYFKEGEYYILSGKVKIGRKRELLINLLDYEVFDEESFNSIHLGRIVPIYAATMGLTQKKIRTVIQFLLERLSNEFFSYGLSEERAKHYGFRDKKSNIVSMHFPANYSEIKSARNELVYEELFAFQYDLAKQKIIEKKDKEKDRYVAQSNLVEVLLKKLPFNLSEHQQLALNEISSDMRSTLVMERLLHGEVGCGKTIVALLSMLLCSESKHQSALMAPTDILARQHFDTYESYLRPLGVAICLLTSSMSAEEKKHALHLLAHRKDLIVIGTHSLIQKSVEFFDLKYVVIDEQHRFGVEQRQTLRAKARSVDVLMMSATPIPRSLAMSVFGNLDITTIRGRPLDEVNAIDGSADSKKRRFTKLLDATNQHHAYKFLLSRVKKGEQGYVVFPIINPSAKTERQSLMREYKRVKNEIFKLIPIAFLHGQTNAKERTKILSDFKNNKVKVLFATTIVEVGIDNPNATVLIIASSEHFGLSQLHQLRGRVGRGNKQGYCYLLHQHNIPEETQQRLLRFCDIEDGFKIAELDLELRGPGELLGMKQAGIPNFKLAHLVHDYLILEKARAEAQDLALNTLV